MSNFDEKLKSICTYHSDDGTSGYQLSEEQFDQIKQLISEVIGERKSVDELVIPEAMNDLASKVCFKEGYNTKVKELRHAFNLKGE